MLKGFVCYIKGHKEQEAGYCPFTGRSYNACIRCSKMIEVQNA